MDKEEYLKKLDKLLKKLPEEDRKDLILDYEEHFTIGVESGRTEEEISEALGDPENVAKQIKADYMVKKAEDKPSPGTIIEAVLAVAGLGLFNLIFVAGPSLLLAVVLISLIVAGFAIIVIGILTMLSPLLQIFFPKYIHLPVQGGVLGTLMMVVGGIGVTVMGTFFVIVMAYAANKFYKVVINLLKSNIEDIKERTEVFK